VRRSIAQLSLLYVAAVVLGVASAWLWLTRVGMSGVDAGIWRPNLLAGSREADAYTRARISLGAVLALDRSETLYYTTEHDDDGNTLRAECRYRIDGTPPPARWWSITAYADDHFLFANPERRYSISGENAPLDEKGRFTTLIGPNVEDADRPSIPTSGTGGMRLTLRLYGADEQLQRDPGALVAPSITRLGDCP
jgi:hypothetical protein